MIRIGRVGHSAPSAADAVETANKANAANKRAVISQTSIGEERIIAWCFFPLDDLRAGREPAVARGGSWLPCQDEPGRVLSTEIPLPHDEPLPALSPLIGFKFRRHLYWDES